MTALFSSVETAPLTDAQAERIHVLADAIAEQVGGNPELALSVYGMGLSVLVDSMNNDPAGTYRDLRPILRFLGQGLDYAESGEIGPDLAAFLPDLV